MEVWEQKKEMELSSSSILRTQSEFVNSPFIELHQKLIKFRLNHTSKGLKLTNTRLQDYLERLRLLKE